MAVNIHPFQANLSFLYPLQIAEFLFIPPGNSKAFLMILVGIEKEY